MKPNSTVLLILIMGVLLVAATITTSILFYQTALSKEKARLELAAQSQARLIEAVAGFNEQYISGYPGGGVEATLSEIRVAEAEYAAFGKTGEFVLARLEGDEIVFLIWHRHSSRTGDLAPDRLKLGSSKAEPMELALQGKSGTMTGKDYRGEVVLAAYEPVHGLGIGIVAKIDLSEIRAPYIRIGLIVSGVVLLLAVAGAFLFTAIASPLTRRTIESERLFRSAFEDAGIGMALVDLNGNWLRVNDAVCEIVGYSRAELLRIDFPSITHPDDLEAGLEYRRQIIAGEIPAYSMDKRYLHKTGAVVWITLNVSLITGADDKPKYFVYQIQDITKRKLAEQSVKQRAEELAALNEELNATNEELIATNEELEAQYEELAATTDELVESQKRLAQSEMNLSKAQEIVHIGNWTYDHLTHERKWSDELFRIFGLEPTATPPSHEIETSLIHHDDRDLVNQASQKLNSDVTEVSVEYRIIHPDGEVHFVLDMIEGILDEEGNVTKLFGVTHDITERKQAEETVRAVNARLVTILSAVPDIIMEVDSSRIYTWANKSGLDFFGDDVIGHEAQFYFEGEQKTYATVQPLFMGSEDIFYVESWQRRKDGEKRLLAWWCRVLKDARGIVTGALSVGTDITERKRAEEALHDSHIQLANAVNIARLGPWELDIAQGLFTFNDALYAVFRTYAEREGGYIMPLAEYARRFVHPEDAELVTSETQKAIDTDDATFNSQLEHRIIYADGQIGYVSVHYHVIKDEQGRTVRTSGVNQDITERKRA